MEGILRFLRGYLRVRIWGGSPERFLNLCACRGIYLWDIRRCEEFYDLYMDLKSFYKLRPIARKTGVKTAILERIGLHDFSGGKRYPHRHSAEQSGYHGAGKGDPAQFSRCHLDVDEACGNRP